MITVYQECPSCHNKNISKRLTAKDHTVSHTFFEIWECSNCSLRFTQSVPGKNEIDSFYQSENYISHTDTNKGLINSLYHRVRKRTLNVKRKLIEYQMGSGDKNILDIGAGTGAFINNMHQAGWNVIGIEPDEDARATAKKLYDLELRSSESLFKLPSGTYDVITMWHVLEHVHDLHEYLDQIKLLLKMGGSIFIAVPNYTCYDEKIYKEFWAAYDVPRHLYHFSPAAMKILLAGHGLEITASEPMWYDSFYVSLLSEKYKTGKNNFISGLWNGFVSDVKAMFNKQKCSSLIYVITAKK
ncbi:MAG: class I SAM-dependent methyltransferase [Chitinophagaceae bacterium]|nr:class I SAM-dependent methyltransferase [Chitinophagaceae bacterium]